jgi:hypothetical protein
MWFRYLILCITLFPPPFVLLLLLCALLSCYQNLYYPTFHILHVGVNKVCLVFLVITNNFFFVF